MSLRAAETTKNASSVSKYLVIITTILTRKIIRILHSCMSGGVWIAVL